MRVISNLDAEPLGDAAWDSFVAASPDGHLFQTSRWGALKARFGWEVERVALTDGDSIVAGAQVFYRSFPFGLTLSYIPKGPLVDWDKEKAVRSLLEALRQAAHRRRAFCLKLEPDLLDDPALAARLVRLGLRPSPQTIHPRSTIIINLDREEDEILARMKPRSRYNIRLAARKGVVVRDGTTSDLSIFQSLLEKTARRKDFVIHSAEFYRAAYDLFVLNGHARFILATYQDTAIAGIMVFTLGRKAWHMFGASRDTHRNLKPNHLLQWEAIRWARAQGCVTYDHFGIPDEVGQHPEYYIGAPPKRYDGMWGVYHFKQSFGGRVVRYLGAYDDVYIRPLHWFYSRGSAFLQRVWGESWHRRLRSG